MTALAQVPMGEVCKINPRDNRSNVPNDTLVSFVPMSAIDERLGAIMTREERPISEVSKGYTTFQDGDVLFAKITPCMENGKAAIARELTNRMGSGSTEFYVLRPNERVIAEFVYHFVRQSRFREMAKKNFTGTAGQQRVPKAFMENVVMPLPPLGEQRRIVDILNRATTIERLRTRAQELLEEFIPALFVRMFGDPVENPMGWETVRLNEFVSEFRYGTSKKSRDAAADESLPVLRIPNVVSGAVNLNGLKYVVLEAKEQQRLKMAKGDLLFVRTNGNPQYVGRCSVFDLDLDAAFASYLIRARLVDRAPLSPYVIGAAMGLPSLRSVLLSLARTTAGNYNINIANLGKIELPVPPIEKQKKFLSLIASSKARMHLCLQVSELAGSLRCSLMDCLLESDE